MVKSGPGASVLGRALLASVSFAELVELVLEVADLLPERDHFAYARQGDAFVGEPHDLAEPLDLVPAVAALTTDRPPGRTMFCSSRRPRAAGWMPRI